MAEPSIAATAAIQPVLKSKPVRRKAGWQLSLRTLLICMFVCSVVLIVWVNRARNQRRAVERIKALGAQVYYGVTDEVNPPCEPPIPLPAWLIDRVGKDAIYPVYGVYFETHCFEKVGPELNNFQDLRVLRLGNFTIDDDAVLAASKMQNLTTFQHLGGLAYKSEALSELQNCQQLLTIDGPSLVATDSNLESWSHLPELKQLSVNGSQLSPLGAKHLGNFTTLESLKLVDLGHPGEVIANGKPLPNLTSITLTRCKINQADIEQLGKFPNLVEVSLFNCKIVAGVHDKTILHESAFPSLRIFNAYGCNLGRGDPILEPLKLRTIAK